METKYPFFLPLRFMYSLREVQFTEVVPNLQSQPTKRNLEYVFSLHFSI